MSAVFSKMLSPFGGVLIVCFFLPWITVSCSNMPVIQNVSALDLAQGVTVQGQPSESAPEMYVIPIGGAVLGIAGLVLWGKKSAGASILAVLGAAAALAMTAMYYYTVEQRINSDPTAVSMINVEWEIGFWGALIAGAGGLFAGIFSFGDR